VDFDDIAARELHDGCVPIAGLVGIDKDRYAGCFSF
jgi:hypothetical protein